MTDVVTCFLMYKKKILLLKRSNDVKTYKGHWAGISGYIEKTEKPFETAVKEIVEETGLKITDFKLVTRGKPIKFKDNYKGKFFYWAVHPFIFSTTKKNIEIDWEHVDHKWILPEEITNFQTVPKLKEVFESTRKNGYQLLHGLTGDYKI
jgi:8-oxo-dGTP pyrophosphatase MutT (NUDIX family)